MSDLIRLQPHEVTKFLRSYRFIGSTIRMVKLRHRGKREVAVEFHIHARETITALGKDPRHIRLKIVLEGVDEYRFQMRPRQPKAKITDARIGYHNGLFYVTFDSVGLEPNEPAKVFDFRASEIFAAGRELFWQEVKPKGNAEGEVQKP